MTLTVSPGFRLVLARHGETEWSLARKHTGRTDIPLTENGAVQAAALKPALASVAFRAVMTSPLVRARHTAELAGFPDATTEDALLEVDYGKDEGRTTDDIRKEDPGWSFFANGPHEGETLEAAGERVGGFLARVARTDGVVLCFAHGHILRILAATYLGMEPRFGRHLLLDPASIGILGQEHGVPAIASWNVRPDRRLVL